MAKRDDITPLGARCEVVKGRVTVTATGLPAEFSNDPDVKRYVGNMIQATEPGWFWIGATPWSAANIRRRGIHAVGTLTTTFMPPQDEAHNLAHTDPSLIPPVASQEWTDLMIEETRERRERGEAA